MAVKELPFGRTEKEGAEADASLSSSLTLATTGLDATEEMRAQLEALKREVELRERAREKGYAIISTESGEKPPPGAKPVQAGHGKLTYNNDDTYEGETVNEMRHGKGEHKCANGDSYNGDWKFDKRDGHGLMVFASGLRYEGEWKDDKTHGHGVCHYPDGQTYEGDWELDQRWGWGKLCIPVTGESYEGLWKNNVMHGGGRYTFSDGSYYEGEYKDGQRTQGKFVSSDGSIEYQGAWKNNLRHGYGTFYQKGVQKYLGEWKEDQRHGKGRCEYCDGVCYDGEWVQDKMQGSGKWSAGQDKYEGSFVENEKSGEGSCQYEDGSQYQGSWKKSKRHGAGKCLYGNGDLYQGQWENDKKSGKGTCKYSNGDEYKGDWKEDARQGYGVCIFHDGTKYRGEWLQDKWIQSSADPEFTHVFGPGLARGVAGAKALFGIQAYDDDKNKRLCGGDGFSCYLEGPSTVGAEVLDNDDGTYIVEYTGRVAGRYELFVTIGDGELVADSPYPVEILPGKPCPKRCTVSSAGLNSVSVGVSSEFFVEARDAWGNACRGKPDMDLQASITSATGNIAVEVEACDDGTFRCRYWPRKAGLYRVELLSGSDLVVVGSSPYSLSVAPQAGEASAEESTSAAGCVQDEVAKWENIAKLEYAADGETDGWDSEPEEQETAEEKYIREHPDVAVVNNLEDMWKVGRYQQEKKELERKEKEKRLQQLKKRLEESKSKLNQREAASSSLAENEGGTKHFLSGEDISCLD